MQSNVEALIAQLCELRVLDPDAEAEALGAHFEPFEQFVRDRMDEWHAAIDAFDQQGTDSLLREVFITRSAKELADCVRAQPVGPRTSALAAAVRSATAFDGDDLRGQEAIAALRSQWQGRFERSERWKRATSMFCQSWTAPWVVLACRAVVREARGQSLEQPSPIAPWIALWSRGVWATPFGEGGVGLWIPTADAGADGIERALSELSVNEWNPDALACFGFMPPRSMRGPGCHGVVFFGGPQTDNIDATPALWLVPPMPMGPPPNMPMPTMNLPPPRPPTPNLPTPQPLATNVPLAPTFKPMVPPPTPQWPPKTPPNPPPDPPLAESDATKEDEPASLLDRLRRWWKK